ncbi:hypothetical protein Q7C18_09105 [Nesterenkonia sp. CL21]|uniref:hypothetical protein n=1 Tax=Nesterenkonia sp. CL21 TaxID=3064894 RepID=UPI002878DF7B|nr:hypothetical protein [Nesterenkonia sp. CL21]MDS2172852.1 hypothetical protein [Nesterenkonia sp. CL21]
MEDSTEDGTTDPTSRTDGQDGTSSPQTRRARREARQRAARGKGARDARTSGEGQTPAQKMPADEPATDGPAADTPTGTPEEAEPAGLEEFDVRETAHRDPHRPNMLPFVFIGGLVVLVTLALLWWFLIREEPTELPETVAEREDDPGIDGVILRDAAPDQWLAGDCLTGFQPHDESAPATIIECDHSYDVQVIHWEDLEVGEYPGDEEISERAHRACEENGQLDQDAVDSVDFALEVRISHPTESTWRRESDRRVNCLLQPAGGTTMTGNFVVDPEEHSSAADDEDAEPGSGDDAGDDAEGEEDTEDTEDTEDETDDADSTDADA